MRFIQVGVGGFGQSWLGHVQRDRAASLVALADINPQALEAAREQTRLAASRCFEDYRKAFDTVPADATLIVTPPGAHHEVALAAFAKGLHVLSEKPMADTMEHAHLMVRAGKEAGLTLMVSQNYRFRPWARTMAQLLQSGRFGAPDNMSVRFAKVLRAEGQPELKLQHGLVRDMSVHHFDLMRALTGREAVWVWGRTWQPAWSWFQEDACAVAAFEFEGGLRAFYEGTWVTRGRETGWDGYWSVECAEATIELRGERVHVIQAEHPGQDAEVELQRESDSGQTAALAEFQQAVAEKREPETSGRDNLRSLAMCFALTESSRTGMAVEVAPLAPEG